MADLNGIRVLAVDDTPDTLELLRIILEQCGATVTVASSAEEAFKIFQHEPIDVLVSDIAMPGRDGYWLMEHLRVTAALTKRRLGGVAVSGVSDNSRARAMASGFDDFLQKPVEPEAICDRVAAVAVR